ncbi:DUF1707 domain-containing protein [Blastococcus sp. TBT05-19]|uniref:DUF1707 SHOCT-like domain-containing protein n=1 Tax=Blastococcus sp. TBT05-19 TaxID=2250581 RepID=UPI000DEB8DBC|nr:DUF1707 domain-containing protein [Blastococcus sp. TBT05-19]RBY92426.1 DUF1707 domain-containing protein [Blastococcus sp. TBT05-19]
MHEPHLRAADADRTAVATTLGEHMAAGRLTVAEYEDRLERTYAAKTYGELAELTADLPSTGATLQEADPAPTRWHGADAAEWRSWAGTGLIVVAIWAITSLATWEFLYFWPIWVLGPWGAVLLAQRFFGDDEDDAEDPPALPGSPDGRARE